MNATEARALARKMMDDNGLTDWRLTLDRHKTRLGICYYASKTISLSEFFFDKGDDLLRDTILHEIAHALCGHTAGHGPEWKRVCRAIGGEPNRQANVKMDDSEFAWVGKCPCGGAKKQAHRRPKYMDSYYCKTCGKGLSWTHKGAPVQRVSRTDFASAAYTVERKTTRGRTRTVKDGRGPAPFDRGFTDIEALFGDDD